MKQYEFPFSRPIEPNDSESTPLSDLKPGLSIETLERSLASFSNASAEDHQQETTPSEFDALAALLPGSTAGVISDTFRRIDIAEHEISVFKRRYPEHKEIIDQTFKALVPTKVLEKLSDDVYRAHAREILSRAVTQDDLRPATAPEILATLSAASKHVPLDRTATLLYFEIFAELFPSECRGIHNDVELSRPTNYERGDMSELRAELSLKFSVPERAADALD